MTTFVDGDGTPIRLFQCQADFVISQCLCILSESRGWTSLWIIQMPYGRLHTAIRYRSVISITVMAAVGNGSRGPFWTEMEETRQKRLDLLKQIRFPKKPPRHPEKNWSPRWMRNLCRICWKAPIRWKRLKCMRFLCDRTRGKQYREQRKFRSCIYRKTAAENAARKKFTEQQ